MRHSRVRMNLITFGSMTTMSFREFGENLGTRQLGKAAHEKLCRLMSENDKVVLDFSGVKVVSNSFADECLAKLLLKMSLDEIKAKTTFRDVNDFARANIAIAFRRRLL